MGRLGDTPKRDVQNDDSDESEDISEISRSMISARFQKPKDPREIITAAIAATNQPIKITWENITFSAPVSKAAGCCKT